MDLFIPFVIVILIIILFVVSEIFVMGQEPFIEGNKDGDYIGWDLKHIEDINAKYGFVIDYGSTQNFVDYLISQDWKYGAFQVPGDPNEPFPEFGKGKCMTDWYNVKDSNTEGPRTIRDEETGKFNILDVRSKPLPPTVVTKKTGWWTTIIYLPPSKADNEQAAREDYKKCLDEANRKNANVFGLQYGGQCLVGNTNEMANNGAELVNGYNQEVNDFNDLRDNSRPLDNKSCNRVGFPDGNGSGWTQTVYARSLPRRVYRFTDYEENIKILVDKNIKNYSLLKDYINVNSQLGFTTIEGATDMTSDDGNGIPVDGLPLSADDIIQLNKKVGMVPDLNQNIIEFLNSTPFAVTEKQEIEFVNKMTKYNIRFYVAVMKWLDIQAEDTVAQLFDKLKELNPDPNSFINEVYFVIILKIYGVDKVSDIIDFRNNNSNWFTATIKNHGLHKLSFPMFPPTGGGDMNNNVVVKMWRIGVTAKLLDEYFSEFSKHKVEAEDYFKVIHPILQGSTFNFHYQSKNQLETIINSYVQPVAPGKPLTEAFTKFNEILGNMQLNYQGYISFIDRLTATVGPPSDPVGLFNKFKTYYTTVAYIDDPRAVLQNPVTANMIFSEFIDIFPEYFVPSDTFSQYLDTITTNKYTIASIQRDIKRGKTYTNFSGAADVSELMNRANTESFGTLTQGVSSFFENAMKMINRALGFKEGATTQFGDGAISIPDPAVNAPPPVDKYMSQPNAKTLNNFGITDFGKQLGDLESGLINPNYGISNWQEMMDFIEPISKIIQYPDLNKLIGAFTGFGARNSKEWLDLATQLQKLNIRDFQNIYAFLNIITKFGVKYNANFNDFIETLTIFKADLVLSPPALKSSAISVFCKDMIDSGYKYDSNPQIIKNIVGYFVAAGYDLQSYVGFPSLLVKSLNYYDRFTNSAYKNKLHDIIQDNPLTTFLSGSGYETNQLMAQAYMLSSNQASYKNKITNVSYNFLFADPTVMTYFIGCLYAEELNALKMDNGTKYANMSDRIAMINDIADAMIAISKSHSSSSSNPNSSLESIYKELSYLLRIFPVLSFEFLYNDVSSSCGNGNSCKYDLYVDPATTYCKATTTNRTTNYRKNPPVVPP